MSDWDVINKGKSLPLPPQDGVKGKSLDGPVGKVDGRTARATGRREQFNPRVHPNFLEGFKRAQQEECVRTGQPISQGYLLEMMLAAFRRERAAGAPVSQVVLPGKMMQAAEALAKHLDVTVDDAVGHAITERMVSSGLAKVSRGREAR